MENITKEQARQLLKEFLDALNNTSSDDLICYNGEDAQGNRVYSNMEKWLDDKFRS